MEIGQLPALGQAKHISKYCLTLRYISVCTPPLPFLNLPSPRAKNPAGETINVIIYTHDLIYLPMSVGA